MVKRILNEVVILAGALIAAGESGASLVPAGSVGTPLQIVLTAVIPFLVALVARQHTVPLHKRKEGGPVADLTALVAALDDARNAASLVAGELQAAKAAATPQDQVDQVTAGVQSLAASLHGLLPPPAPPAA